MRKTKFITIAIVILVLATLLLTTLVACQPNNGNESDSGNNSGEIPSGVNPPDSGNVTPPDGDGGWTPPPTGGGNNNTDDPEPPPMMSSSEFFDKIIGSVEAPDKALNIDLSGKVETGDMLTTLSLKGNFYDDVRNELCFSVYQQKKNEADAQKQLVFAIYIISDKIYLDMADGSPLIYLSDFDFNYVLQIVKGAGELLPDMITGSVKDIIDLVVIVLFGSPEIKVAEDGSQSVLMEIKLKEILGGGIADLLGVLPIDIPIDLAPIINYLASVLPDYGLYIKADFDSDGFLDEVGVVGMDKDTSEMHFDFNVSFEIRDVAESDIGLPDDIGDMAIAEFSFTNIQFSIDLVAESVKNEDGTNKNLDVGKLINGFLGASSSVKIPEGLLLINGGTGIRLTFKLDLDLNYDKLPVDNNKVAIELFLIHPDGTLAELLPQLGIYYTEGSFYLNTDNMLPDYLNGLNLKLDASLNDLVSMLVDLVTDAIDDVFGLDFAQLRKNERQVNDNGTLTLSNMSAVKKVLSSSNAQVVALAAEDDGSFKLSAGVGNFVEAVANLLGLGKKEENGVVTQEPNIFVDGSQIKVVVNNRFFQALGGLITQLQGVTLPPEIGDIVLSINTSEVGLDSVSVNTVINNTTTIVGEDKKTSIAVDPALSIAITIGKFLIGEKDTTLASYIDSRVDKENTNYLSSLNGVIEHMLGGIRFSSGFTMNFDAGTYDLAPFIAGFGVPEVENSQILWTFTNDFVLDASLNLQIALNRTDTAKSMIVLELKTESGISVGDSQIIEAGKVLLGIYGYNNSIYIDISNFNIAGIVLPKLSFSLNFTDLVYTLLDDVVSKLLTQINVQGGDLKFELNFKDLFGQSGSVATNPEDNQQSVSTGGNYAQAYAVDPSAALVLLFNTEQILPSISLATILAILEATNTDIGSTLTEALSLMELDLSVEMGRKDGFTFNMSGEFIPKLDENGEGVYYYDASGNKLTKKEGQIFKHIKFKPENEKEENANIVYYHSKKYNYGSNMKVVFAAGTEQHKVIVGNLGEYKYPIEKKAEEFDGYKSDLIQAIVDTVGKASVNLDIDLHTLDNTMNLTRLINMVLANMGKKLDLPISLDLDDWNAHVQLALAWDLDLTRFSNSKIMVELRYEEKVIFGVYINRNSVIVDLTGLGLFSGEIVNSSIVSKVFGMVDGLIKQVGDFDLNKIINDLLKNNGLPTVGTKPEGGSDKLALSDEIAKDGDVATLGEGLEVKDFIAYLTQAIHLENTAIVINFTSALINGMLEDLVGLNLGINLGVNGNLDLFGDSLDLGITVEDITMDASLSLSLGKDVIIPIDFDDVPDWDASSGTRFAETLLNTVDIGFTIDLANHTGDVVDLEGMDKDTVADNYTMYTRVIIEKVQSSSGKKLVGVKGTPTAPQGSFVVTLAHINKAMYNDNQSSDASMRPLVYVWLDHRKPSGQLGLAICSGLVNFIVDVGETVGIQYIDLDIIGMLGPVFDDLLKSIDGALDGLGQNTNGNEGGSAMALAADSTAQEDEPTGLDKVFADLDIIKLLGKNGIMANLRANGTFNLTIEFDPYLINKLIDDILSQIFSKGTGHGSMLNLKEIAPDMFDQDYLSQITWTRERYGANGKANTFWGDLKEVVPPLLKSLISGLGYGGLVGAVDLLGPSLGGVYYQVRQIISALVPFAVWNTATLEVNIVDATISNIHFRGQDNGQDIHIDNDPNKPVAYSKDEDARGGYNGENYFTEIFIYNSSKSVGESTADGTNNGIVTWADIPTSITFMPYIYTDFNAGVTEILKQHFTSKEAIYQKGTKIMRASVTFEIVDGSFKNAMNKDNLAAILGTAGNYRIIATARFSGGITRTLNIDLEARDYGGGLDYIEDIEMHAYDDSLPDFLTVHTKDGKSRKINTEYLSISNWRPNEYKAHDVDAKVAFRSGEVLDLKIHYLDSSVDKMIIGGVEGKNVNVNLYEFDLLTSKIEDFTPQTLYFKYADGKAVGLDILNGWDVGNATDKLFNRPLDKNGEYSTDVTGCEFSITTSIAAYDGCAPQQVELVFIVRTKKVEQLTINGEVNTISIDPYKFFMYMIGESEENPFPDVVEAQYYDAYQDYKGVDKIDTYKEEVNVTWKNLENIVFNWNNNNDVVNKVDVVLDNAAYPNGSFAWEFKTQVSVLRNEVEAIYFDEELTQATLFIDPFQYLINGKGTKNFPDHAYVQFTNGAVYYMPIAWMGLEDFVIDPNRPAQFRQFEVAIGFDPEVYNNSGDIVDYTRINGTLLQHMFVNVQVENRVPKGIELQGSELVGGTYYIDPINVLYYGSSPFPDTITVRYMSGKTSVIEVRDELWIRDFAITMKGAKGLKASVNLGSYAFDFNVEIIDRSNLKPEVDTIEVDPYVYTTDEKGNRVYNNFADNMNLYQKVGTINTETFEVEGRKQATYGTPEDGKTFLKYVLTYIKDGETLTYSEKELDYIRDFLSSNTDIEILSAEVFEYFNVPIAWDLTEINYVVADIYTVKAIVQAIDAKYNKEYKIKVDVKAKKVVEVVGGVQYVMVGGTNLSETAKLTQKLTFTKLILFDDGTSGSYEVTLDLTKFSYDKTTSATLRWSSDNNGNLIITDLRKNIGNVIKTDEEVADCAMDIEVTVCSGDIAQKSTMKVHVLDNQVG